MEKLYPIEGFEHYMITKSGKVWSKHTNRFLKIILGKCGYSYVDLWQDKKRFYKRYHRVLAKTFIPNPKNKPCINHINGIKSDNRIENLEWCTYSENSFHAFKHGLNTNKGEINPSSKLKEKDVIEIRKMLKCKTYKEIGDIFGVHLSTIAYIKSKKLWGHV